MKRYWTRPERLLDLLVVGLAVPTIAIAATMSKDEYNAAKERASAEYKSARARCDGMKGQEKDICVAEAKAGEKKAKAEAEASYKNTDKARRDARLAAAEADYEVAKERCKTRTGNDRDVCMKEAKAAETKAKADARASNKVASARADAAEDKREADRKVALERCESLSGNAKDACVARAKAR